MRIRTRLLLLVLAVLIPALICAGLGIAYTFNEAQKMHRKAMRETTRALSMVLERELARREAVLKVLAASPALVQADLEAFYRHAAPLAKKEGVSIFLSNAQGKQLLNTRLPFGAPLPDMLPDALTMRAQAGPAATIVSDIYQPPAMSGYSFAVQTPVLVGGQARYYLNMSSSVSQLQSLFDVHQLPQEWHAGIADRDGIVLARSKDAERFVGRPVRDPLKMKLNQSEHFHQGTSLSGEKVLIFLNRIPGSGWTFYVGVADAVWLRAALQTAAGMAAITCMLLGLAVAAALLVARRTALAIESTRHAAEALGRGEALQRSPNPVLELDTVDAALVRAGEQLRNAHAEQERRVAEAVAEAERSQRALLHAQKMEALGRLTGGIAHDFNNVLQTVATGIEIATRRSDDAQAQGALESCKRAVGRAAELTRQLAVFGRRQETRAETIDPAQRLREIRPMLAGGLRDDVELDLDIAHALWPVTIDPLQLELALLNLTMNARDALPSGGTVRIEACNARLDAPLSELPAGDYLRITVSDNGTGMPPEVLANALDPFFTTKEIGRGSGMGLPQAYGFARQSGGTLVLQSTPGAGTQASLYLPRVTGTASPAPAAAYSGIRQAAGETVLLVEDDALVREVVRPALEAKGFRVLCAGNAAQALDLMQSGAKIDLLFSDVVMPGALSGIDLARRVRAVYPDVAVVLASGYTENAIDVPGVRTLAKPYEITQAVDILLKALKTSASMR